MHFYKELCSALLSNLSREFLVPEAGNSKNDKNYQKTWKKMQKLVSFCVFVFVVQKHIAQKTVIKSNFVSQKFFVNY